SRGDNLGEFLQQARDVVDDPSLEGRLDIQGLRDYMRIRDTAITELLNRQNMGGSPSLTAEQNIDVAQWFYTKTRALVNNNLLFAEIYHRYLEDDDLTASQY